MDMAAIPLYAEGGSPMLKSVCDLPILLMVGRAEGQEYRFLGRDNVKELRWQTADGWAVADCYVAGEYYGRYVIDGKGRHGKLEGRKRRDVNLMSVLHDPYLDYHTDRVIQQPGEAEEAAAYIGKGDDVQWRNALSWILMLEAEERGAKRRMAWARRRDKINSLMDLVPPAPDDLDDFIWRQVFREDFLFPSDKDSDEDPEWVPGKTFYCSACRNLHRYNNPPKLGQAVRCGNTGRMVIRKRKGSSVDQRKAILVLQEVDSRMSVARHFIAYREAEEGSRNFYVTEEIRIMLYKDRETKDKVYYGQLFRADEWAQEWEDKNVWQKRMTLCHCYTGGIKEALAGTKYEQVPVGKLAAQGWELDYNSVMLSVLHKGMPAILEHMAAMGMRRLVRETSDNLKWGIYYGPLNSKGEGAAEVFGVDMQRVRRMASLDGGSVMLGWLRYELDAGVRIRDEVLLWLQRIHLKKADVEFILDRMSPEQVRNYIMREGGAHVVIHTVEIWKDYLSMAGRLGLDVQDAIVYRAKGLYARHDEAVEEFQKRKEEIEAAEFEEKYGGIARACARVRDKFDYVGEEFRIITPQGAKDIMDDSSQLHHCAGASERYYERIEQDETYILFLRKNSEPEKAWYTLEVEPDGTARQKRSAFNRQPDLPIVNAFLREWQAVVRGRMREEDRQMAQVSARKREEEMAVLAASGRQRDADLYKALSADLLPAEEAMAAGI